MDISATPYEERRKEEGGRMKKSAAYDVFFILHPSSFILV
jgi:hypothetical protein